MLRLEAEAAVAEPLRLLPRELLRSDERRLREVLERRQVGAPARADEQLPEGVLEVVERDVELRVRLEDRVDGARDVLARLPQLAELAPVALPPHRPERGADAAEPHAVHLVQLHDGVEDAVLLPACGGGERGGGW